MQIDTSVVVAAVARSQYARSYFPHADVWVSKGKRQERFVVTDIMTLKRAIITAVRPRAYTWILLAGIGGVVTI